MNNYPLYIVAVIGAAGAQGNFDSLIQQSAQLNAHVFALIADKDKLLVLKRDRASFIYTTPLIAPWAPEHRRVPLSPPPAVSLLQGNRVIDKPSQSPDL